MGDMGVDLIKAAMRVAVQFSRNAGDEGAVEDLGMSAEYGQDADMSSTHTQLENDDLESVDTRPSQELQCQHVRALPGQDMCPDCGGQLIELEGY